MQLARDCILLGPDGWYRVTRYKIPKIVEADAELVLMFKTFFGETYACSLVEVLKDVFSDGAKLWGFFRQRQQFCIVFIEDLVL